MVTGTPVTVTIQWPEKPSTGQDGGKYGHIWGHMGSYRCDFEDICSSRTKNYSSKVKTMRDRYVDPLLNIPPYVASAPQVVAWEAAQACNMRI